MRNQVLLVVRFLLCLVIASEVCIIPDFLTLAKAWTSGEKPYLWWRSGQETALRLKQWHLDLTVDQAQMLAIKKDSLAGWLCLLSGDHIRRSGIKKHVRGSLTPIALAFMSLFLRLKGAESRLWS